MSAAKHRILCARIVVDFEIIRQGRIDLGERHATRDVNVARVLCWRNSVPAAKLDTELAKAAAFAAAEGYTVHVYPMSERDPIARAKQDALAAVEKTT